MNLYLIRHGDAEKASLSKSDSERELTSKGKVSIKKAAEGWKRTIKSADIIADVFDYSKKITTDKRITIGNKPNDVIDFIRSFDVENIAIVGHEPDMSNNLSAFTSSAGMYLEFKKGTIAKISFEGKIRLSAGTLEFLIPLKVFE
ncbi:MAG: hypothetical protein A2330_10835 [Ignavibacteria bacterium RIFOXYB2_FULL_36_7]|nr:MAG: hypothetical protein A2330_10835 [Ignavibacteria bacterium RIFOXYB2_FULL_36_7]